MPEGSPGWPAQTDQTQACGRTCTVPQLAQERTTLNLFPLLCGLYSATALEPSKSCWHLWECSVFLRDHPFASLSPGPTSVLPGTTAEAGWLFS